MTLNRRQLLAGAAAVSSGLAACSGARRNLRKPLVSIVRAQSYSQDLAGAIRRVLADHKVAVHGKRVLLKPNLVEFDSAAAVNTHPAVVLAAFEVFRSLGAAEVRIAEGPGHRRNTLELAEAAGYFQAIARFEDTFCDLNIDDISRVALRSSFCRLRSLYMPQAALRADLIVSIPKMKTHHWVGATLSMKNLFGLVPGAVYGWPKNILHWAGIDECVAAIHAAFPRYFALVDGIVGMEGNGPIQGKTKPAGVIVAGSDLVAVDATCCRIMGIAPGRVRYLQLAASSGQTEEENVKQIGEPIRAVASQFELIPEFRAIRL